MPQLPHLYAPHLYFISLLPIICGLFLVSAALLRPLAPALSIGFLTILTWCWVIAASYISDTFSLPLVAWIVAVVAPVAGAAAVSFRKHRNSIFTITPVPELIGTYFCWLAGIGILLIPLAFFVPPDTVVAARHVCNDIVSHALVAKGKEHLTSAGISMQLFTWYPRGFHTVLFYLVQLFGFSQIKLIFPFLVFSYSFVIPFTWDLADAFSIRSFFKKLGLTILVCSPFLGLSALYQGFAAQLTVMPIVLLTVFRIFLPPLLPLRTLIIGAAFLILSAVTAYTIFPLTVIGLALTVKGIQIIIEKRFKNEIRTILAALNPKVIFSLVGLVIFFSPALFSAFRFLFLQTSGDPQAGDILKSAGNLTGYLSPLHLSSIWPPDVYHTNPLTNPLTWIAYLQVGMLAFIFGILLRSRLTKPVWLMLLTLFIPVFFIPVFGPTEYVHFKYLTLSAPPLYAITGLAILLGRNQIRYSLLFAVFVLASFSAGTIYSGRAIGKWPVVGETEFERYMMYRERFFSKGSVVVVTQDDWFRYFADRKNTYIPFMGTFPTLYQGQNLNYIFLDKIASGSNAGFLAQYPELKKITDDPSLIVYSDERVDVFKVK